MDMIFTLMTPATFAFALGVGVFAGVIKGVAGFGLPAILYIGLALVLPPDIALVGVIFASLVTNAMQALRQGATAAWDTMRIYRLFLIVGAVVLIASAQLLMIISPSVLMLWIGVVISVFIAAQLVGWQPRVSPHARLPEIAAGAVTGFTGGIAGIWAPSTVAYLTAVNTPKTQQVRAQGIIFGLGALLLAVAHVQTGVLRAQTWPFSAVMILPCVAGMWVGTRVQDAIPQAAFKRVTLLLMLIGGLHLVWRGITGL